MSLFLAYPFAAALRSVPNKNVKHFLSFFVGFVLCQWIFEYDWIHTFISSGVTYLICLLAPKKSVASLVFIWAMGYMTMSHIYRMYVSYLSGVFDFTGTQMVLTMKLTSFAYNYYDGTADRERVFKDHEDKKVAKIYAERKRFAIQKLPNLLEYFGYVYCFTCILAGPAFEFNDYIHAIDGSAYEVPDKLKKEGKDSKPPSPTLPGLGRLAVGIVTLVGHLVMSARFPMKNFYNVEIIRNTTMFQRYLNTYIALFGERLKYYFVWKIAEGSSIMAGFGFEGYDENGKSKGWSAVENIDIWGFESAANIQQLSRAWNKRTQGWLERYTYNRQGRSLLITYFVSAFWHGLYPGFFFFFLSVPLMTEIERAAREKLNPIFAPGYNGYSLSTYPKTAMANIYWMFCWVMTTLSMNYIAQVFSMQSGERCLLAWGSYYHFPHILMIVVFIVLKMMPKTAKKKETSTKSE